MQVEMNRMPRACLLILGVSFLFCCPAETATTLPLAAGPYPRASRPTGAAGPLYVVADGALSAADVVTLQTLSGCLARDTPRIYRVATNMSADDSYSLWARLMAKGGVNFDSTFQDDFHGLLRHFASNITGYVTFSPGNVSVNAAITYCAGTPPPSVVVAASEPTTIAVLEAAGIKKMAALESANVAEVYAAHRSNFRHRLISFQPPSKSGNLAEYAVFSREPTLEYEGNGGGPLADIIMADVAKAGNQGAAMGWGPEVSYVRKLSAHSIYVHASDWSKDVAEVANFPVHSALKLSTPPVQPAVTSNKIVNNNNNNNTSPSLSAAAAAPSATTGSAAVAPAASAASAASAVHTASFLFTDGDNIQWLLGPWAVDNRWYGSKERGTVPAGWTISPALASLAPVVLSHAYGTATVNDSFVAGPSGVGYIYPKEYKDATGFANLTNTYFGAADLDIVNVIDDDLSAPRLAPLLEQPGVRAAFLYTGSCYAGPQGQATWVNGKPVFTARAALWGDGTMTQPTCENVTQLAKLLAGASRDPGSPAGYSLIPVHAWSHDYADVIEVVRQVEAITSSTGNGNSVRFVTPREFVDTFVANVKPNKCPTPAGSFSDSCTGCSVDQTSCVLTCKSCKGHGPTEPCNLNCCTDLSNNDGRLWCQGRECPSAASC